MKRNCFDDIVYSAKVTKARSTSEYLGYINNKLPYA